MSAELCMTVREFRAKYGIEQCTELANAAARTSRPCGWRGLKAKVAFAPTGARTYPVSVLLKIARVLGARPAGQGSVVPKEMMSIACFKLLVPGLGGYFSMRVANYCNERGIKNAEKPRRYPYEVLKMFAEREGKSVPDLPVFSDAASDTRTEVSTVQPELPLDTMQADGEPLRADGYRARMLAAAEENTRLLRELLAEWKGVAK